jgi:hypothetical protein
MQGLEAALSDACQTITQLRRAAASCEQHTQATVSSLLSELADKGSQLVDAERRLIELEALMQRIASRTSGGGTAEGWCQGGEGGQLLGGWGLGMPQSPPHKVAAGRSCGCYSPVRS